MKKNESKRMFQILTHPMIEKKRNHTGFIALFGLEINKRKKEKVKQNKKKSDSDIDRGNQISKLNLRHN